MEGKSIFLEILINGEVNIYFVHHHDGEHYYIDKPGERLAELTYSEPFKADGFNYVLSESK